MSIIYIRDGVGCINHEPVSWDVDYSDRDGIDGWHTRRFRIDAGNGYELSVVFSTGAYCENHFAGDRGFQDEVATAEIGVLRKDGGLVGVFEAEWGDSVKGHCDAAEIMLWLARVRELEPVASAAANEGAS